MVLRDLQLQIKHIYIYVYVYIMFQILPPLTRKKKKKKKGYIAISKLTFIQKWDIDGIGQTDHPHILTYLANIRG